MVEGFDARPRSIQLIARRFSGENQQKIVVGRELLGKPRLLIAAQPTQGVDVGAIEFIPPGIGPGPGPGEGRPPGLSGPLRSPGPLRRPDHGRAYPGRSHGGAAQPPNGRGDLLSPAGGLGQGQEAGGVPRG